MDELILELISKKYIQFNTNNSSSNNPLIFDFKNIISYQYLINNIIKLLFNKIRYIDYNNIIGVPSTGIHIASILSYNHNIPLLMFSKHNLVQMIGDYEDNTKCVVITDLIYTGSSILKYLNLLKKSHIIVTDIITICDSNNIKNDCILKYNIHSLFDTYYIINLATIKQLLINDNYKLNIFKQSSKESFVYRIKLTENQCLKNIFKLIETKKYRICFSNYLTDIKELVRLINIIGKYITILEINSYQIDNFTHKYGEALRKLANNFDFFIVNDIGVTNMKYLNPDMFNWCSAITISDNIELKSNMLDNKSNFLVINNSYQTQMTINKYKQNIIGYRGDIINDKSLLSFTDNINKIDDIKNIDYKKYDIITLGKCISINNGNDPIKSITFFNNLLN